MAVNSKARRTARPYSLHKPRGIVHDRVQAVGAEHFAFICVDSAKARSKMMMADFYGRPLLEPTTIEHTQPGFDSAIRAARAAIARCGIKDVVVVVERTGQYHRLAQRAFRRAGFEVRIVHPFATKQYRQPTDPGNKTDDTDLSAMHRAAVNGLGLLEHEPDPLYVRLQMLARHRRDLVQKRVTVQNQMLEHLQAHMPGYARCFSDVFESEIALWVARNAGSAQAILQAGAANLSRRLANAGVRKHTPTVEKIMIWARSAPPAEEQAELHRRIFLELEKDRESKMTSVEKLEGDLAELLCLTPYVLLLSIPGINVVSAAEFAGEAGPIERYRTSRSISGRAGLYPSRYQSDEVDRRDGSLVRCANRSLRYAIMIIADNLIMCNDYFRGLAVSWRAKGKDPRDIRVKVTGRFCRIAYYMVAGGKVYQHPCARDRHYILAKLIKFSIANGLAASELKKNLAAAAAQVHRRGGRDEAAALEEEIAQVRKCRGAGLKSVGEILPEVLCDLEMRLVTLNKSGESELTE
jgi:transposase